MASFNLIPTNLRAPATLVEIDASQAQQGPSLLPYRALLVGQKTSAGSAEANTIHRVTRVEDVIALAGRGSMLHRMAIAWFASNRSTELWIGVLADDGAGVAATGSITFTDSDPSVPGAEAGTIVLYLGGVRVTVPVAEGDDQDDVADAAAAAINANLDLPVTAIATDNVVALTFRHKGVVGNGYDLRHSYRDGEGLPEGIEVSFSQLAAGATNPSLDTLIAALGDTWFHIIAHPYTDATSLEAIEEELADRFGPMRMIDGVAITSAKGSVGTLAALGNGRNSPHSSIVAQAGASPLTPPMEHAAEAAALVALYGAQDPARPFQTLPMRHAFPLREDDCFTFEERNSLLFDGIATTKVGPGSVVQLERMITTYQQNAAGAEDAAYLDVTTMLTLMYLRYDFRTRWSTRYPRHKLANDGTRFGPGQAVVTPSIGKGVALNWFLEKERQGLVEDFEQFKRDLVVERSEADPNRLDFIIRPNLINGLIDTAVSIQFRR